MHVHIMNFSYQDAIVIECDGRYMMVDSGEDTDQPDGSDERYPVRFRTAGPEVGRERQVIAYLRQLGATPDNFDVYIGTHAHSDHIGSADEVIDAFRPARVYTPEYDDSFISNSTRLWDNQYVYDHLCESAYRNGATLITSLDESAPVEPAPSGELGVGVTGNPIFQLGSAMVEILNYDEETHPKAVGAFNDANSYSYGVLVSQEGHSIFLSGDIDNHNGDETRLAQKLGHVDVLKLGHHGYVGSNDLDYLRSLSPDYAIQTGPYARLPQDIASLLADMGTRYYPMDELSAGGAVATVVTLGEEGVSVSAEDGEGVPKVRQRSAGAKNAIAYLNGLPYAYAGLLTAPDGNIYYFGSSPVGVIAPESTVAWKGVGGGWQLIDAWGELLTGWQRMSGKWYYLDPESGMMATGWKKVANRWYLFERSGVMRTGWCKSGSKWYYFNSDGAMRTGWQLVDNAWYYLGADGVMRTGWLETDDGWYYLTSSGAMSTGWRKVGSSWYYFAPSGLMATGLTRVGDASYYLDSRSGAMRVGWQRDGDDWRHFKSSGEMTCGWGKVGGRWYYFDEEGLMATGWRDLDGRTYFFESSGAMVVGVRAIDGEVYRFLSNGDLIG